MKSKKCFIGLLFGLSLFTACKNDDPYNNNEIYRPDGILADDKELLGGVSTVWSSSSSAYGQKPDWVTGEYSTRFYRGNSLYDRNMTSDSIIGGGKGPVYAGHSCGSCHFNDGRTTPTFGTGSGFSTQLIYITKRNGSFLKPYGRVLHDQAIYGVEKEGTLHINWHEKQFEFPDGEEYTLRYPEYKISDWYVNYEGQDLTADDIFVTVRIPLRHVGMGLMMALDQDEIKKLAAESNYPEYGISGRCNYVTERGVYGLGLSGNKAQHQDLTVELGFSSDMGVTNDRFPEEVCEGQAQMWQMMQVYGYANYGIQISSENMEDVDLYMSSLGVPARRNCNMKAARTDAAKKQVEDCLEGEQYFYEAKCHLCHVTTLHTKREGVTLLNGTRLPWLGGQTIHPYSDYLLHDMGSEIMGVGLNDNYTSGLAQGNEWRTTPLWGIGLQKKVNSHTYFLHDGRARNLNEAIMWHGGEGYASRQIYAKMGKEKRDKLIKFLESL